MKYLQPIFVKAMGVTSATRKLKSHETAIEMLNTAVRKWAGAISLEYRNGTPKKPMTKTQRYSQMKATAAFRAAVSLGLEVRPAMQAMQPDMAPALSIMSLRRPKRSTMAELKLALKRGTS